MTESRFAWAAGLATIASDGTTLDAWFPAPELGRRPADRDPLIAPTDLEELSGRDTARGAALLVSESRWPRLDTQLRIALPDDRIEQAETLDLDTLK